MQVHAPPSARGAAPPALLCFVLGPWHPLVPSAEEGASSPKCASGAPSPLPSRRGWGVRGRSEAAQAALARSPARPPAPPARCCAWLSGVGRSGLAAADCSRELAGLQELRGGVRRAFALHRHTPPFSALLGRVKKTKTGLSSPVRRALARGVVIRVAPAKQRHGRCSGTRSAGRGARGGGTAGPFRESGGGRGSGDGRSPRQRATASRRPLLPGPLRAAGPGFVRRGRVRGGGSGRPQRLLCPRTAAALRALAA